MTQQRKKETIPLKILYLPEDSCAALQNISDPIDINLYLAQNHFMLSLDDEKYTLNNPPAISPFLLKNILEVHRTKSNDSSISTQISHSSQIRPSTELCSLMKQLNVRNQQLSQTFSAYQDFTYQPANKLLIGDNSRSPYSSIQLFRLHQLYGLPYLPASAIKGNLRSFWILNQFAADEASALADPLFSRLFGCAAGDGDLEGALIFFDTFPDQFIITLDIQTPHFAEYYSGKQAPTDDQNPKPIYFICLQKSVFTIPLACQDAAVWAEHKTEICHMMNAMLTQYGLGAKTALGYGLSNISSR